MNNDQIAELYKRGWDLWGKDAQLSMLAEECCELAKASLKIIRKDNKEDLVDDLAEEVADVEIMLEQVKQLLPLMQNKIDFLKEIKLSRLAQRIKDMRGKTNEKQTIVGEIVGRII